MIIVAAFLPDAYGRTRVAAALGNRATIVVCSSPHEILPIVASTHASIVFSELRSHSVRPVLAAIREISASYPFTPLIAHCSFDKPCVHRLLEAGAAGFTDVLFDDCDDAAEIDSIVARAETAEARSRVATALRERMPTGAHSIMIRILKDLPKPVSVGLLSESLGISRRTLSYQLRQAHLPTTLSLITRTRLLLAACLMEDSRRSIKQIARDVGYGKSDSLYRTMQEHAGIHLSGARAGGFAQLLGNAASPIRRPLPQRTATDHRLEAKS